LVLIHKEDIDSMNTVSNELLLKLIAQKDKEVEAAEHEAFANDGKDSDHDEKYMRLQKLRQEVMDLHLHLSQLSGR
jgi:hypothetical protein